MTTTNPAPEPGQHVWIEAEVRADGSMSPVLASPGYEGRLSPVRLGASLVVWQPADADLLERLRKAMGDTWAGEEPVGADEAAAILDAVRTVLGVPPQPPVPKPVPVWERSSGYVIRHPATPADVPPQPPVLADVLAEHFLADLGCDHERAMNNPRCACSRVNLGWYPSPVLAARAWVQHVLEQLADVPGPDDSTPTPEPDDNTAEQCGDCDRPPQDCHCPKCHAVAARRAPMQRRVDFAVDDEPQSAGEGAALIAATEQEIADMSVAGLSRWEDFVRAWEATARRLAALLDAVQTPVQATTHGEVGEAQAGVQGDEDPPVVHLLRHLDPIVDTFVRMTVVSHPARPLQVALSRASEPHPCCIARIPRSDAIRLARDILAAYNLDELTGAQQPAAQGSGRDWRGEITEALEYSLEPSGAVYLSIASPRTIADHLVAELGLHDLEQAAAEAQREVHVLQQSEAHELVVAVAERDAARRELEQLRGEVGKVASSLDHNTRTPDGYELAGPAAWVRRQVAQALRTALAATAPATQDGAEA